MALLFDSAVAASKKTYATRSAAARAARSEGFEGFYCEWLHAKKVWMFRVSGKAFAPAVEYAQGKGWIHHVETCHRGPDDGKGGDPRVVGVCVVNITKHELDLELADAPAPVDVTFEPLTRDLWEGDVASSGGRSTTGGAPSGTRAKSDVASPSKLVWETADKLTAEGKDRKEIIAACIEAGVNKATANTQYYRWAKARA